MPALVPRRFSTLATTELPMVNHALPVASQTPIYDQGPAFVCKLMQACNISPTSYLRRVSYPTVHAHGISDG